MLWISLKNSFSPTASLSESIIKSHPEQAETTFVVSVNENMYTSHLERGMRSKVIDLLGVLILRISILVISKMILILRWHFAAWLSSHEWEMGNHG